MPVVTSALPTLAPWAIDGPGRSSALWVGGRAEAAAQAQAWAWETGEGAWDEALSALSLRGGK